MYCIQKFSNELDMATWELIDTTARRFYDILELHLPKDIPPTVIYDFGKDHDMIIIANNEQFIGVYKFSDEEIGIDWGHRLTNFKVHKSVSPANKLILSVERLLKENPSEKGFLHEPEELQGIAAATEITRIKETVRQAFDLLIELLPDFVESGGQNLGMAISPAKPGPA